MKNENIVCLREIVTYNEETDTKTSDEMKEDSIADKGFSIGDVFMVFEFVDYDLSGLLSSPGFVLSEQQAICCYRMYMSQVKSYMKQLLSGVNFLHEHKILHRDIKSANLLITKNNVLKIADWGLARTVHSSEQKLTNPVVTLWYRSPEVICGSRYYSYEVDIWSVG
jgi:cyclin-dependent kinase 12/13